MKPWITVVGVVGTVKRDSLSSAGEVSVYLPDDATPPDSGSRRRMTLVVRTRAIRCRARAATARGRCHASIAPVPVKARRRSTTLVSQTRRRARGSRCCCWRRSRASHSRLGAVGYLRRGSLRGRAAHARDRRPHGARRPRDGRAGDGACAKAALLAAIGVALGIAGALAASRLLAGFLFGVTPSDPAVFVAVPAAARRSWR